MLVYPFMVVTLLGIAGCGQTTAGDAARSYVKEHGKKAAAYTLENTLWTLCRAVPVGAVRDRFMQGSKQWAAYVGICDIPYQSVILGEVTIVPSRVTEAAPTKMEPRQ